MDLSSGFRNYAVGVNAMRPLEGGRVGLVMRDENLDRESDLTLEDLRAAILAVWGSDFGLVSVDMISRFTRRHSPGSELPKAARATRR